KHGIWRACETQGRNDLRKGRRGRCRSRRSDGVLPVGRARIDQRVVNGPVENTGKEHPVAAAQYRLPGVEDVIGKSHPGTDVAFIRRHEVGLRRSPNLQTAEWRRQLLILVANTT